MPFFASFTQSTKVYGLLQQIRAAAISINGDPYFSLTTLLVQPRAANTSGYPSTVSYLIVAGGGGGGGYMGAGGGAGGLLQGSGLSINTGTTYTVTIGGGGAGGPGSPSTQPLAVGANGSNSGIFVGTTYLTANAIGGGGGGTGFVASPFLGPAGRSGGSGGGAGGQQLPVSNPPGGLGTPGQGSNGGQGNQPPAAAWGGAGGGGGAGFVGGDAGPGNGAPGGTGIASSISGTPATYAGGGGGGTNGPSGAFPGGTNGGPVGSPGGAGTGSAGPAPGNLNPGQGAAGTPNTGGGGGGSGGGNASSTGGAGGSGVIFISYPTSFANASFSGALYSESGGNRIYRFNSTGSLLFQTYDSPNNQVFLDSSTNNQVRISRTGNTTQGIFTPFVLNDGYWSNYFNGTSDYIFNAAGNSDLALGTGDFTVECIVYLTAAPSVYGAPVSLGTGVAGCWAINCVPSGGGFYFRWDSFTSGGGLAITNNFNYNQLYHVAYVRSGSTLTAYVDGVAANTISGYTENLSLSTNFYIGTAAASTTRYFPGYISNVRVVKGAAVYTSDFGRITEPLTVHTSGTTAILTCRSNRFVNNSNSTLTFTRSGSPSVQAFTPFTVITPIASNTGSVYFDGTGDYVTPNNGIPLGAGDFTIDLWVYSLRQASSSTNLYTIFSGEYAGGGQGWRLNIDTYVATANFQGFSFGYGVYGSYTVGITTGNYLSSNTWQHLAVTRTSGTWRMFVDGVSQSFTTQNQGSSFNVNNDFNNNTIIKNIGESLQGYIYGLRVIPGTSLYSANFTPPTSPPTPVSGTSLLLLANNAAVLDTSGKVSIETVGDVRLNNMVTRTGTGSFFLDGAIDFLKVSSTSSQYAFGTDDFTIEILVYFNTVATSQVIYDFRSSPSEIAGALYLNGTGGIGWYVNGADRIVSESSLITVGTWYHVAVTRYARSTRLFINGIQKGITYADTNNYTCSVGRPYIGALSDGTGTLYMSGNIEQPRITVGTARYLANFAPPTIAFANSGTTAISNTTPRITYLIIGGGGGGGGNAGGGGGGGGFRIGTLDVTGSESYTVAVGAGGTRAPGGNGLGTNGGNSGIWNVSTSIWSTGGGRGGSRDVSPSAGATGGSGGGGGGGNAGGAAGAGTAGQGNNGGTGRDVPASPAPLGTTAGGGGGGAGAIGGSAAGGPAGAGGIGLYVTISGSNTAYAGGGGAGVEKALINGGAGGAGGGGLGGSPSPAPTQNTSNGTINTGGGGGGGGLCQLTPGATSTRFGGTGGSGVVIIRYAAAHPLGAVSGANAVVSTSGLDRIITFNESGTITF
jgi:hypothetical protein